MKIKRILTNNAVITVGENNEDKIVCGKGIGYKKKIGDDIEDSLINQSFVLENDGINAKFEEILVDIPIEYLKLSYDIIKMVNLEFAKKISDTAIIPLSDHLYTAIQRDSEGIKIKNALLWDIQRFYENEYEAGLRALDLIEEKMNVRLSEDEAGFIALHIVNAQMDDSNMENIYQITKVIQEITTLIKYYFSIEFDVKSAYYFRFITHLKFFALRLFNNKQYVESNETDLLEMVKHKYIGAYTCASKVKDFIYNKYSYSLSDEEILYLTIHINRIVSKSRKGCDAN